jgi:hypothetical protein
VHRAADDDARLGQGIAREDGVVEAVAHAMARMRAGGTRGPRSAGLGDCTGRVSVGDGMGTTRRSGRPPPRRRRSS